MKCFGIRLLQTFLVTTLLSLVFGCSREPDNSATKGDVRVRIPWQSEDGTYSLQVVTLKGLESLEDMRGKYVSFKISPTIDRKSNKLKGHRPKARFMRTESGVYVATDELSQQMAVIWAHMQKLSELDVELGAGGVNTFPRDVGVAVRLKNDDGSFLKDNAMYTGASDSTLVVPYTRRDLPISVNGGIMAHEYFHSLYFKLVDSKAFKAKTSLHNILHGLNDLESVFGTPVMGAKPLPGDGEDASFHDNYHLGLSLAMNEGLADFWAWIYSGDPDFIAHSLPSEKLNRTLSPADSSEDAKTRFVSAYEWKHQIAVSLPNGSGGRPEGLRARAYLLGTQYARQMRRFSLLVAESRSLDSITARREVGKALVKSLRLFSQQLQELKMSDYVEPVSIFALLKESMTDLQPQEAAYLDALVGSVKVLNASATSVRPPEVPRGDKLKHPKALVEVTEEEATP